MEGKEGVGGQQRRNESRDKIMQKREESGTSEYKLCLPGNLG